MTYADSFKNEDYLQAREAFQNWQGKQNETIDDYIFHKRKAELIALVRQVIKDELTSEQKLLVQLHWYKNYSAAQIAEKLGLSRSTISRKLNSITDIIYDKLKYAMMYRYGDSFSKQVRIIIKSGDAFCSNEPSSTISSRIHKLRKEQLLSLEQVCDGTGISIKRIIEIEKGDSSLSASEIQKFALFYNVSSDYIIFGKDRSFS